MLKGTIRTSSKETGMICRKIAYLFLCAETAILFSGCGTPGTVWAPHSKASKRGTEPMGYAVQVGAFSVLGNAVDLTEVLWDNGLDAYYFPHETGMYKVRFGNFSRKGDALRKAEELQGKGVIHAFYIVGPEDYPTAQIRRKGEDYVRDEIVKTAQSFLGIPYRWGGVSPENGFDCSGLTLAVYQLNGLDLPRSTETQWEEGTPVDEQALRKADLVFFATSRGKKISHVGIYVGDGKFVHAPGTGKEIRISSLSNVYFRRRYVGARSYL
jgi:hypothetical protein